jgi:hypothetical protein
VRLPAVDPDNKHWCHFDLCYVHPTSCNLISVLLIQFWNVKQSNPQKPGKILLNCIDLIFGQDSK